MRIKPKWTGGREGKRMTGQKRKIRTNRERYDRRQQNRKVARETDENRSNDGVR